MRCLPFDRFSDDLWLDVTQCREKGLIEVVFEGDEALKEIIDWMKGLYYEVHLGDRYMGDWKTFYDEIIERVVAIEMKPLLEKRAGLELRERAWDFVVQQMKETFCRNFLMVPPYLFQKKP